MHLTCLMTDSFEDLCQFRLYKITALGKLAIYNLKTALGLPFKHFRNGQKRKTPHENSNRRRKQTFPLRNSGSVRREKRCWCWTFKPLSLHTCMKNLPIRFLQTKTLSKGSVHWSQFNGNLRFYMWVAVERKWGGGGVLYGQTKNILIGFT